MCEKGTVFIVVVLDVVGVLLFGGGLFVVRLITIGNRVVDEGVDVATVVFIP